MIDICCECNKKSSGAILTGVNHSGLVFGKRKPPNNRVRGGGRVLTYLKNLITNERGDSQAQEEGHASMSSLFIPSCNPLV